MIFFRRVVGDSMTPTLQAGQIVIAYHVRNFRVGQIVVAHVGTKEVIKRITSVKNGRIFLEGDNKNHSTDSRSYGSVVDTNVEGIVVWPRLRS